MVSEREYIEILVERKEYLEKILRNLRRQNEKICPELSGKIRVQKKGNVFQYYLRQDPKDTTGKYLRKENKKLIMQLLQRDYNDDLIQVIKNELVIVQKYISNCNPAKISDLYERMSKGRQEMIVPISVDDAEFVASWEAEEYEGKAIRDDTPEYYTMKGERVRSKSEVIIANLLLQNNVPYRYEYPIYVNGMGTVYPDFTALNVRKRKQIYIEHLGMLGDEEYRDKAIQKVTKYEQDDITIGDNLMITYETDKAPLNIPLVVKKIEKMLL